MGGAFAGRLFCNLVVIALIRFSFTSESEVFRSQPRVRAAQSSIVFMMLDFSRKKCLLHGRLESRWQVASKVELMMLDFMGMKLRESGEVGKNCNFMAS